MHEFEFRRDSVKSQVSFFTFISSVNYFWRFILEHTKRQVKVSFLSRNSLIFPYMAPQFALCFFLSWDGQKKTNTCDLVLFFLYTVWWLDTLKKRRKLSQKVLQKKRKGNNPPGYRKSAFEQLCPFSAQDGMPVVTFFHRDWAEQKYSRYQDNQDGFCFGNHCDFCSFIVINDRRICEAFTSNFPLCFNPVTFF